MLYTYTKLFGYLLSRIKLYKNNTIYLSAEYILLRCIEMKPLKTFLSKKISIRYLVLAFISTVVNIAVIICVNNTGVSSLVISVLLAASAICLFILAFLFIGRTNRLLNRPIREIITAIDALAEGDVEINFSEGVPGDMGKLIYSMRILARNIREQAHVADMIAAGDLTVMVPIRSKKDILGRKLYTLIKKNNKLLREISSCAEQVSSGARSIAESSQYLAQGAAEQSSSIEEITVTIDEIAARTKKTANKAEDVNIQAVSARDEAGRGNEKIQKMLISMENIKEASENIAKIISVIESIAFQTNILALNAAIEAARAGTHGKGFAVVADQVKNLAGKSSLAAKEIAEIIQTCTDRVNEGMTDAQTTADELKMISDAVQSVTALIDDITSATAEQAEGLEQVRMAISQVSTIVQSNTATSEQSAAASQELAGQASMLMDMVDRYKLEDASLGGKQEHVYLTD